MPNVYVRFAGSVGGRRPRAGVAPSEWTVPIGATKVRVTLDGDLNMTAAYETFVSDACAAWVGRGTQEREHMGEPLAQEVAAVIRAGADAERRVLAHLRFTLGWGEISEHTVVTRPGDGIYWSLDKEKWERAPGSHRPILWAGIAIHELDPSSAARLQILLDHQLAPLLARRHLRRAFDDLDNRFSWIDATIAAELAIKETLLRLRPELRALILELPSPPIGKLYGPVLEAIAGEESPHGKALSKGAETRNRLIHRPEETAIDTQDARNYVSMIRDAIEHLEGILAARNLA